MQRDSCILRYQPSYVQNQYQKVHVEYFRMLDTQSHYIWRAILEELLSFDIIEDS